MKGSCGAPRLLILPWQALACAMAILPLTATPSVADEIDVPLEQTRAIMYTDPGSPRRRCRAASVLSNTGTLFDLESPELAPGVYRVHMRLKMSHTISKHTARLEFTLAATGKAESGARKLTIVDFELPGVYQDFSFPLEVCRKKKAWVKLSASWSWRSGVLDKRPPEPVELPTVGAKATLEEDAEEIEPLEHQLKELPYHLASDRVWLESLGDVAVRDLEVDKIRYRPRETASATGIVRNYAERDRELTVETFLIRGLDDTQLANTQTVTVGPMASEAFRGNVPLDDRMWGHEVRCVVKEDGRELASASQYFTVHTNPWAVAIGGFPMDLTIYRAGPNGRNVELNAVSRKRQYVNQVEFVFWAPDDFGDLNPQDKYWSGQMRRHNSAASTKWLIDAFHKAGISCAFYSKIQTAGGKAGYEVLRRHPDWYLPGFYDVAQLDRWDRSTEMHIWPQLGVRRDIPDPYVHHAEEIIRSVKTFGWDMIRYDSSMMYPEAGDMLRLVKYKVNKACPGFQWGCNSGVHRTNNPPPPTCGKWKIDPDADWAKAPLRPVYDMLCEDGGMMMDEWNNHAHQDRWTYDKYASRHIHFRKEVHRRGGHVVFCPFEPESHADAVYQDILPLAARTHRAWDPLKGKKILTSYPQFATRYAGYVWDNGARPLDEAQKWIDWGEHAQHLFKWESYAYLRNRGADDTDLIVQMVNLPPKRVSSYDDCRVPPPRIDVACSIKLPDGVQVRDVWCATAEYELRQQKLPHQLENGRVTFRVPKLRFWTMLVVRLAGNGKWM